MSAPPDPAVHEAQELLRRMGALRAEIARAIHGQAEAVEQSLTAILAGGHALLVGVPGLGKTRLVETLAVVLGLGAKRIQFTPDLMPADITGSEVLEEEEGRRKFRFAPGPVFCRLLMADEINRASPRTQSALLQAMAEGRVTVGGVQYALPRPFHVLATQNPIEQEGTYPLPEAQLDRFLLQVDLTYPDAAAERAMVIATTGEAPPALSPVLNAEALGAAQALVRRIPVGERLVDDIMALVRGARPESASPGEEGEPVRRHVAYGPGPRAAQSLMLACRARAALEGRLSPAREDILALAHPVLRHRMALRFSARAEGLTVAGVIDRLLRPLR